MLRFLKIKKRKRATSRLDLWLAFLGKNVLFPFHPFFAFLTHIE
ncbi:hypothetical protein XM264_0086 [Enterococcus faecalis]|nr:hypothetical protein XM264_0086 [Enterococcus faecalis]